MNLKKTMTVMLCAALVAVNSSTLAASAAGSVYAKTTSDLNVRTGAGLNYDRITVIDENTKVTVIDRTNPDWLKVKLSNGTTGYCYADYLDITTDGYTTDYVNVRYGASTNYGVIKTVPKNTKVDILRFEGSSWAYIKLSDGTKGYMCTNYVTYSAPSSTTTSVTTASADMKLSVGTTRIAVGTSLTIKASNNQGSVTWKSSNTKAVKIDSSGKATAIAAGTAVITATDSKTKKSVQCTLNAVKTEFTKITLSETSKTLNVGQSFTLKATTNTKSTNVKFKSLNTAVATVDEKGKVTAVAKGTANIRAYDSTGIIVALCSITVNGKDTITLSASNITINAGSSKVITANKSNQSMQINWSSSDTSVACVRGGRISGLSAGTAVITASDSTGKIYAKCTVKVNGVSKGNLYISRNTFSTTVGKDFILKASNGVSWDTSDSYIATVSDSGIVHAHNSGKVAISYCDKYGHMAVCVLTVNAAEPVRAAYNSPNLAKVGQVVTLTAVTDKTVSDVYFKVNGNGISTSVKSTSKTEKNGRYIWTAQYKAPCEGHFTTSAYATRNGRESTCDDAFGNFYVSNTDSSVSYLGTHYVTDKDIAFIREKEGFVSSIRDDALAPGNMTVGYGCVIGEGKGFYNNMITEEANAMLIDRVNYEMGYVLNNFFYDYKLKCNQQQFDALVSFAYNLGAYWIYDDEYDFANEFKNFSSGSYAKDISYMDRNVIINNMTQFTKSGTRNYWGLLYRRIDELEIFFYNEYKNDGRQNKHNFKYPQKDYV